MNNRFTITCQACGARTEHIEQSQDAGYWAQFAKYMADLARDGKHLLEVIFNGGCPKCKPRSGDFAMTIRTS